MHIFYLCTIFNNHLRIYLKICLWLNPYRLQCNQSSLPSYTDQPTIIFINFVFYKDNCLLGCYTMFKKCLLPPSLGWWWRQTSTSETLVNFQTTWCNTPEDSHLHICHSENLKSYQFCIMCLILTQRSNAVDLKICVLSSHNETLDKS
jgi:hypothetical protein